MYSIVFSYLQNIYIAMAGWLAQQGGTQLGASSQPAKTCELVRRGFARGHYPYSLAVKAQAVQHRKRIGGGKKTRVFYCTGNSR